MNTKTFWKSMFRSGVFYEIVMTALSVAFVEWALLSTFTENKEAAFAASLLGGLFVFTFCIILLWRSCR